MVDKNHFLSGGWHIPGGHLNEHEGEEQALLREFKEETNLNIIIVKKLCSHCVKDINTFVSYFVCSANSLNAVPGDDLEEISFVEKNKVVELCDERVTSLWPKKLIDFLSS